MSREQRWRRMWQSIALSPPPGLFQELLVAYAEPHRHYHDLDHIDECFRALDDSGTVPEHPSEVEIALWFHDAIYDPHQSDNEIRSADWATRALRSANAPLGVIHRVHALILATRHDAPVGRSLDLQLMVDIDLAILGAEPDRFDEYERNVRDEYSWVLDDTFRAARLSVLTRFMEKRRIYHTPTMRERLELRARSNLRRSLERLKQVASEAGPLE